MELVFGLALITLVTLLGLENAQGSPGSPGVDPIPPQQLYNEFLTKINKPGCKPKRIKNIKSFAKCMESKPALIDYGCRYYNLLSHYCFCCGQTCSYIEQGDVCTRFCLKGSKIPRGQPAIIDLPFDWGDEPQCTPDIVNDNSTTQSNKSEDLTIQDESDNMNKDITNIETRKDTDKSDEAKTPPTIKPDCVGNNCPMGIVTEIVTPTDVPPISPTISNVPPTHKPDCIGGNCPRKNSTVKKRKETFKAKSKQNRK